MLPGERHRKIKDILMEYNHIDVITLSSLLGVSQVTIRKDLEKMEAEGILTRIHGGAILNSSPSVHQEVSEDPYYEEKDKIAKIASHLVGENEVVFIGNGSTGLQVARHLKDSPRITIVTNNLSVVSALYGDCTASIFCVGGIPARIGNHLYFSGPLTISAISQLRFNKAFLTPSAVDLSFGYSVASPDILDLYNAVAQASEQVIITADFTKFDRISMLKFLPLDGVSTVISNENISNEYKQFFFDSHIPLYTTFDSSVL